MPSAFSDLAITVLIAAVGVLFGWLLRGAGAKRLAMRDEGAGKDEAQRAREVLARLHDLADQVAADVGEHSQQVEAISEELSAAEVFEPDVVVKAIAKLVRVNGQMQRRLASAEGKLQEQARQIQWHAAAARTDALTGLANRRALDDEMRRRRAEFLRYGRTFSLLMIDVDHFKRFNDAHGHQAGDEVLRGVARILRQSTREMDLAARYGGEEFAVVYPEATASRLSGSVEQIRTAIENACFHFGGTELRVTVSLGVAHLLGGEDTAALVQRADAALYASKEAGRNCAHWHDGQAIHPVATRPVPAGESTRADGKRPRPKEPQAAKTPEAQGPGGVPQPGLCNRTEFCIAAGRRLAEWRHNGPSLSVLLVQIDRLPEIVARHGDEAANLALRATSQRLAAAVRAMDLVAHYGHGTFAVLLPATGLAGTIELAERLRRAVAQGTDPVGDGDVRITVSLGGAEVAETDDLPRLLTRAGEALDMASSSGGNGSSFHSGGHCETAAEALERLSVPR